MERFGEGEEMEIGRERQREGETGERERQRESWGDRLKGRGTMPRSEGLTSSCR